MAYEIHPLFSCPVMQRPTDVAEFTDVLEYCKDLKYIENVGKNFTSEDTDILSNPVFIDIKKIIEDSIDEYTKDLMGWQHEFYITQSWLNVNPPGTTHHEHYHFNSIVSGTFYLKVGQPDFITFLSGSKLALDLTVDNPNIWNSHRYDVELKDNMTVLFPSSTLHRVGENRSNYNRVSIAFNVFVKGQLGNKRRLTYLQL
jgi:uncharacterized protein (TIGR02466 family)